MKGLSVLIENSAFTKDLDLKSCLPPNNAALKSGSFCQQEYFDLTPYLLKIFS
jgi:hypothetical protein